MELLHLVFSLLALIDVLPTLVFTREVEIPEGKVKQLTETSNKFAEKYTAEDVAHKTPIELIKLRGFDAEEHFARTKDGYHINVVRIVHPLINRAQLKRPVIFNHGLIECATIWLINSLHLKPVECKNVCNASTSNANIYKNGPMMLANHGYDVWLMSMRGTEFSLKHDYLSKKDNKFWDYSLDDFALKDVPSVIDYVRNKTGAPKIGYIGHSQATFSIFALLSTEPHYNDLVEPVIAVAPVAYFDHITSIARSLFLTILRLTNDKYNHPFPMLAKEMRNTFGIICNKRLGKFACDKTLMLIGGKGKRWPKGYYSHIPHSTSFKVLRHFGQLIDEKRFMMYNYGAKKNLELYGNVKSPSYLIEKIRSKSLCLFRTEADALSPPEDVENFKKRLTIKLFKDHLIKGAFDHFDLITDPAARELVFKPMLKVFEHFEHETGICKLFVGDKRKSEYKNID